MDTNKLNERHLKRLMAEYVRHYHEDRTHLGLAKDTPAGRPTAIPPGAGSKIQSLPRLGGLHRRIRLRYQTEELSQGEINLFYIVVRDVLANHTCPSLQSGFYRFDGQNSAEKWVNATNRGCSGKRRIAKARCKYVPAAVHYICIQYPVLLDVRLLWAPMLPDVSRLRTPRRISRMSGARNSSSPLCGKPVPPP